MTKLSLLVTGANGLLGRRVVEDALRRGHRVRALVRPATDAASLPWRNNARLELVRADLRELRGLPEAVRGIDVVIHCAAARQGDFHHQFEHTVMGTENLLTAMSAANISRLVAISTFAVYDFLSMPAGSTVTEESPLERSPSRRDPYVQTKLVQERLVRAYAKRGNWALAVLRPGVLADEQTPWNWRLGLRFSPERWAWIATSARLPLCNVEKCARAAVLCAEQRTEGTFNVIDDELPTQRECVEGLRARNALPAPLVRIPWQVVRVLARCAWLVNRAFFRDRLVIPNVLSPAGVHARCKPLRYSNRRLREFLAVRQNV